MFILNIKKEKIHSASVKSSESKLILVLVLLLELSLSESVSVSLLSVVVELSDDLKKINNLYIFYIAIISIFLFLFNYIY